MERLNSELVRIRSEDTIIGLYFWSVVQISRSRSQIRNDISAILSIDRASGSQDFKENEFKRVVDARSSSCAALRVRRILDGRLHYVFHLDLFYYIYCCKT
jgi:hypothetical protein